VRPSSRSARPWFTAISTSPFEFSYQNAVPGGRSLKVLACSNTRPVATNLAARSSHCRNDRCKRFRADRLASLSGDACRPSAVGQAAPHRGPAWRQLARRGHGRESWPRCAQASIRCPSCACLWHGGPVSTTANLRFPGNGIPWPETSRPNNTLWAPLVFSEIGTE
jgi:hypothetical protein